MTCISPGACPSIFLQIISKSLSMPFCLPFIDCLPLYFAQIYVYNTCQENYWPDVAIRGLKSIVARFCVFQVSFDYGISVPPPS
jgi:hypothetical protein